MLRTARQCDADGIIVSVTRFASGRFRKRAMVKMTREDCFRVLELPPSASAMEVWTAFLRLARRNNPELHPRGWQNERFVEIVQAYRILEKELDLRPERSEVAAEVQRLVKRYRPRRDWAAIGERALAWWAKGMLLGGVVLLLFVVGMLVYECIVLSFPEEGYPRERSLPSYVYEIEEPGLGPR